MSTLQKLCAEALQRGREADAIEFEGDWYTWGQVIQVAVRVLQLLDEAGVSPDATITFIPRNRPSALAALLAFLSRGRSVRMMYAFQSGEGIARQLAEQKPAVVIADEQDFTAPVLGTMQALGIAGIDIHNMDAIPVPGCEKSTIRARAVSDTPTLEVLTSGTTGKPKQFPISYQAIEALSGGASLGKHEEKMFHDIPFLLYFPLGNITGIYLTVPALVRGQKIILQDRFTLRGWLEYIKKYRPVFNGMPPAGVQMLLDANVPVEDLSSLQAMGVGAAPLDVTVICEFEERYKIPVLMSYGATEFAGPVTSMSLELREKWKGEKLESVGLPIGGAKLRVVDPDSGEELPAGTEGILEVVSPRIGPAWIHTSDIGLIDDDGFIYIKGRADGAIMRGGFKVIPETIEAALKQHPAVSAVCVVGVPDKRLAEVPGAAIELNPDRGNPSIEELETHLRRLVLATHIPVHWRFVETLPKTPSFKIFRPGVKALFSSKSN